MAGDGAAEDYIVVGQRIHRLRPYIIFYIYPQDNQSPTSVIIGSAVVRNQGRPLKTRNSITQFVKNKFKVVKKRLKTLKK